MPIGVTAEQVAIADSVGRWASRAGSIAVVRGLETRAGRTGWPGREWAGLAELGVFAIAVPERLGGAGGSTAVVAVVAEHLAGALVPGPVLPTLLATLVLARAVHGAPGADAVHAWANGMPGLARCRLWRRLVSVPGGRPNDPYLPYASGAVPHPGRAG